MTPMLERLNTAPPEVAQQLLEGVYEHSPWIAHKALKARPFLSLAQLKHVMARTVADAGREAQLALIRAHPELAGKAMVSQTLTPESAGEQSQAGLTHCSADEFAQLQALNAAYNQKFGFPFILAVRGPRGTGLSRQEIIATLARREQGHPEFELAECLRNIHRIAELRLNDKFGVTPTLGNTVWDWHEDLAQFSEPGAQAQGQLTVTYLSEAHRDCATLIRQQMLACGFDSAEFDAVGNVLGRYYCDSYITSSDKDYNPKSSKILLTGSHFDTVRNAGKYDGRLGIFVPLACVRELARRGQRLPFQIEVVAFAEEEGQRFKATFLSSSALTGQFELEWLNQQDAQGITMRAALQQAGLSPEDIPQLQRNPANYLGFVEVHIEQGPVLNALDLPLGVVSAINGSVRYMGEVIGTACHAGTTPMNQRQDAAAAVAELILFAEQRAARDGDSVATIGQLQVPDGSTNVVPGRCQFTLDMRAPTDAQRDAMATDVLDALATICQRRQVRYTLTQTMRAAAAPSAPAWQQRWEHAVTALGVPLHRLPSGAGHDAMKLHDLMPQAMLFVRGQNAGISHNPLESTTSDDMQLAVDAFSKLLAQLAAES